MVIFHSYVKLPEGSPNLSFTFPIHKPIMSVAQRGTSSWEDSASRRTLGKAIMLCQPIMATSNTQRSAPELKGWFVYD
jgi:hypothetical protein